jgi:hypothetical protein
VIPHVPEETSSSSSSSSMVLQPPWTLASAFQFHDHFTDGRTPWTSDQPVARPLSKHRSTQTQNKQIHILNIHALCEIRTTIPVSELAKTVNALDRSATVTCSRINDCVHFQSRRNISTLKIAATCFSLTLVTTFQTIWRHITK